jgi:hypothetical protein
MGLLSYSQFLNEGQYTQKYMYLEMHIGKSGMSPGQVVDYREIFDKATKEGGPEAAVLNEINEFEKFLPKLAMSAKGDIASESEDLVGIVLGGNNSNVQGEADTIFSDVTIDSNGEKVSVKSSNKQKFSQVLGNSPIKINQLFSVVWSSGTKAVSDKEKKSYLEELKTRPDEVKKMAQSDSSLYSIAAAYNIGPDYIVEKSYSLTRLNIVEGLLKNLDYVEQVCNSTKGTISDVTGFLMKTLGFDVSSTYIIKGISGSDLKKLADERKIILHNIAKQVATPELRNVAKNYNLPTDREI